MILFKKMKKILKLKNIIRNWQKIKFKIKIKKIFLKIENIKLIKNYYDKKNLKDILININNLYLKSFLNIIPYFFYDY